MIAEKEQGKIFKIFQRLHDRGEIPGTGIGLAQCKKIAELLNGELWGRVRNGEGQYVFFLDS